MSAERACPSIPSSREIRAVASASGRAAARVARCQVIWVFASAGFAFYVGNFGSYNETYGALGGFVLLLVWFWISNLALLLGLELNSEVERTRQISNRVGGADHQLQLEPRAEPKARHTA